MPIKDRLRARAQVPASSLSALLAEEVSGPDELALAGLQASEVPVPKSYQAAISGEFGKFWEAAIRKEFNCMDKYRVYKPDRLPAGYKAIGWLWAFAIGQDDDGMVTKFRARLVAQGNTQKPGQGFSSCGTSSCRVLWTTSCSRFFDS